MFLFFNLLMVVLCKPCNVVVLPISLNLVLITGICSLLDFTVCCNKIKSKSKLKFITHISELTTSHIPSQVPSQSKVPSNVAALLK